jgi:tRNA threonylcarbamoyladenosine biosynthesis protein TsaE
MEALGARLAKPAEAGARIYLSGDLGAGKTTLVRGFLRALGHQGPVKSPTYTLVEPYALGGRDVYHFDLYRLSDPEELEFLGARDYFSGLGICLVEWPERAAGALPKADIVLNIKYKDSGRRVEITPLTDLGTRMLSEF